MVILVSVHTSFISALRSRTSPGIQSFAQMIDHLHLKNRRLPLSNEDDQNLVGEVNSLDRMQPGSFATYEMQRPLRASQVSFTVNIRKMSLFFRFFKTFDEVSISVLNCEQ